MAVAPLGPEVPAFAGLLISFLALCGAVVAFGMVKVLYNVTVAVGGAVGWLVGHIPGVDSLVKSPINDVFHWMEHVFADAAIALEGSIAFWWHQLGDLANWMGKEIAAQAHALYVLSTVTAPRWVTDELKQDVHAVRKAVSVTTHAATHALDWLYGLDRSLGQRIAAGAHAALRPWEHKIDVTIPRDIAGLRSWTRSILDRLDNVWHRVNKLDALIGTAAFATAVAYALNYLDLGWLRCRNVRKLGKSACSIPFNLLDDILAIGLAFEVVVDPVKIAEAALLSEEALQSIIEEIAA